MVNGLWQMAASLDLPLPADAMRGAYLLAPTYPFKVAGHTGGQAITMQLEPAALQPAATPARPVHLPVAARRRGDAPRGLGRARGGHPDQPAVDPPPYIFRDQLTIDVANPNAVVWVGVSSADAESYVPDETPPGRAEPAGGRAMRAASPPSWSRRIHRPANV